MRTWMLFAVTAGGLAASACQSLGDLGSVYRETDVNDGTTLILDAEQNALVNVDRQVFSHFDPDTRQPVFIDSQVICSQPAPDAAAADSLGFGAGGSDASGNSGGIDFASGQSVGGIGLRTQSVTLLRDAFFRLCEAYQNGAVDHIEYSVNLRRMENTMIAILAVEQLTGAVEGPAVSLSSSGSAAAGSSGETAGGTGAANAAPFAAPAQGSLESVADAVQSITMAALTQDDNLAYCLDMLRFGHLEAASTVRDYCRGRIAHDLDRIQGRAETASDIIQTLIDNPDMPDAHREALMTILDHIAADGEFRGLTQMVLPD